MTALTGLLDGDTAEALKRLYGVDSVESPPEESKEANSWNESAESADSKPFCDNCDKELTEAELRLNAKTGDILCCDCDRRANSHAVDRFRAAKDREVEPY